MGASVLRVQKLQRSSGAESETRIVEARLSFRPAAVGWDIPCARGEAGWGEGASTTPITRDPWQAAPFKQAAQRNCCPPSPGTLGLREPFPS